MILADTKENADNAADVVEIEYEELPAILTIEVCNNHDIRWLLILSTLPVKHDKIELIKINIVM